MDPLKQKPTVAANRSRNIGLLVLVVIVLVAGGLGGAAYWYNSAYEGRILKGVAIEGFRLDGYTKAEAKARLEKEAAAFLAKGLDFTFDQKIILIPVVRDSRKVVQYSVDEAVERAYKVGRSGNGLKDTLERVRLLSGFYSLDLKEEVDTELAKQLLDQALQTSVTSAQDAQLQVSVASSTTGFQIDIVPERVGVAVDEEAAIEALVRKIDRWEPAPIELVISRVQPKVTSVDLQNIKPEVETLASHGALTLAAENKTWNVSSTMLLSWIGVNSQSGSFKPVLLPERVLPSLRELAKMVIQEPKDGKLVLGENNTLKEFEAPVAGVVVNATTTIENIYQGWQAGSSTVMLALDQITPQIIGPDAERLGIREVLGVGRSNFSGSPTNRRKNMALGVKHMNGLLLAPGEEFSQLKVLGEIDGAHDWLPELVIKGNKTTPEFGGGLCQVGTTSFRMALNAGLKITQRQNHSYRVRYYEPVGTDATIYDPAPDFRFKNDTANYVLITAAIQNGDDMIFTTWGTKDGRVAKQENYKVYGITAAPPTKYIETTDLAPGKVKCTETAHAGASASFDYVVTQTDGTEAKETFKSYYKPWGAVCLKGVAAVSAPAASTGESVSLTE